MVKYQGIKSKSYLKQMLRYIEEHLNCHFHRSGKDRYSAYCPFHVDTKDSFGVYVDKEGEVRFKCFGACSGGADKEKLSWDIYSLSQISIDSYYHRVPFFEIGFQHHRISA